MDKQQTNIPKMKHFRAFIKEEFEPFLRSIGFTNESLLRQANVASSFMAEAKTTLSYWAEPSDIHIKNLTAIASAISTVLNEDFDQQRIYFDASNKRKNFLFSRSIMNLNDNFSSLIRSIDEYDFQSIALAIGASKRVSHCRQAVFADMSKVSAALELLILTVVEMEQKWMSPTASFTHRTGTVETAAKKFFAEKVSKKNADLIVEVWVQGGYKGILGEIYSKFLSDALVSVRHLEKFDGICDVFRESFRKVQQNWFEFLQLYYAIGEAYKKGVLKRQSTSTRS